MLYIQGMNIISISDARAKLPKLVNKAAEGLDRFLITVNSVPKVAIISLEELESLEETIEVAAIPGAYKSIQKGLKEVRARKGVLLNFKNGNGK